MALALPAPNETVDLAMDDGAIIRLRRHGNPAGPRLALSHGNGLAIDGYYSFWRLLQDRYDLILFDFRNHGQNPCHKLENHNWPRFVRDLEQIYAAIQDRFGVKRTVAVFHSLSAVAATMQAQQFGARWDPLVLFDPPYYPPEGHWLRSIQFSNEEEIADRAEKRTLSYADPMELAASFARRMTRWQPEAYELMARATLRWAPAANQWLLACPREFEAKVFRTNRNTTVWTGLAHMPVAVKLICGDPDAEDSMPPARLGRAVAAESSVAYEAIPETTHFLQIEKPRECVRAMESFLHAQGVVE
ncbi:MAG: alpha/beta fold hydrolase [Candidatus Binataceae bacterium]